MDGACPKTNRNNLYSPISKGGRNPKDIEAHGKALLTNRTLKIVCKFTESFSCQVIMHTMKKLK